MLKLKDTGVCLSSRNLSKIALSTWRPDYRISLRALKAASVYVKLKELLHSQEGSNAYTFILITVQMRISPQQLFSPFKMGICNAVVYFILGKTMSTKQNSQNPSQCVQFYHVFKRYSSTVCYIRPHSLKNDRLTCI